MAKKFLTFFAAIIVVTAAPAFTAKVPQTHTFSGTPDTNGVLAFDKFDTHGGTWILNSIQVTLNLNTSGGRLKLDNDSEQSASGTFEYREK